MLLIVPLIILMIALIALVVETAVVDVPCGPSAQEHRGTRPDRLTGRYRRPPRGAGATPLLPEDRRDCRASPPVAAPASVICGPALALQLRALASEPTPYNTRFFQVYLLQ